MQAPCGGGQRQRLPFPGHSMIYRYSISYRHAVFYKFPRFISLFFITFHPFLTVWPAACFFKHAGRPAAVIRCVILLFPRTFVFHMLKTRWKKWKSQTFQPFSRVEFHFFHRFFHIHTSAQLVPFRTFCKLQVCKSPIFPAKNCQLLPLASSLAKQM